MFPFIFVSYKTKNIFKLYARWFSCSVILLVICSLETWEKLPVNAYGTLLKQTCLKCDYMHKDIFQQLQKGNNVQGIWPPVPQQILQNAGFKKMAAKSLAWWKSLEKQILKKAVEEKPMYKKPGNSQPTATISISF